MEPSEEEREAEGETGATVTRVRRSDSYLGVEQLELSTEKE